MNPHESHLKNFFIIAALVAGGRYISDNIDDTPTAPKNGQVTARTASNPVDAPPLTIITPPTSLTAQMAAASARPPSTRTTTVDPAIMQNLQHDLATLAPYLVRTGDPQQDALRISKFLEPLAEAYKNRGIDYATADAIVKRDLGQSLDAVRFELGNTAHNLIGPIVQELRQLIEEKGALTQDFDENVVFPKEERACDLKKQYNDLYMVYEMAKSTFAPDHNDSVIPKISSGNLPGTIGYHIINRTFPCP